MYKKIMEYKNVLHKYSFEHVNPFTFNKYCTIMHAIVHECSPRPELNVVQQNVIRYKFYSFVQDIAHTHNQLKFNNEHVPVKCLYVYIISYVLIAYCLSVM